MSNDLRSLLQRLVELLDASDVPFMVAGSFASTAHGLPRTTQDLDLVIHPHSAADLEALLTAMPPEEFYVDADAAREALRRRSMFNAIHLFICTAAGRLTSSFVKPAHSAARSSNGVSRPS